MEGLSERGEYRFYCDLTWEILETNLSNEDLVSVCACEMMQMSWTMRILSVTLVHSYVVLVPCDKLYCSDVYEPQHTHQDYLVLHNRECLIVMMLEG
jgi:hypothetical protein